MLTRDDVVRLLVVALLVAAILLVMLGAFGKRISAAPTERTCNSYAWCLDWTRNPLRATGSKTGKGGKP